MIGEVFDGRYKVLRLLGQGGMGAVYEAEDVTSGRRVAVKVIHTDRRLSEDIIRRFRREARAGMAVPSRHIAQVLEVGADPVTGAPYLVMEYLTGEDLEALGKRLGPLPSAVALRIVGQACSGLHKAHEAGIVHRDIKPANLFLAREEGGEIVVKLLDFGIAKIRQDQAVGAETTGLTRTGSMLGSPLYMSPEQARGIKGIDHRSDVWSLGVVLYRALTGRAPHQEIDAFGDLIMAICSKPPPLVQSFAPWVPSQIAALPHAALRIDPADRYQSAAAMLEGIRSVLQDGLELREEMLVPLSEAERGAVAERLDRTTLDAPPGPDTGAPLDQKPREALEATVLAAEAHRTSPAAPAPAESKAPARARSRAPAAIAAALALVLGAVGLYRAVAPAQGSGTQAPMEAPPAEARRVQLRVTPADTSVEIDGAPAPLKDGSVELTGALFSIHQIRLTRGQDTTVERVVITEHGAVPAEIALGVTSPASIATATATTTATATATTTATPTARATATATPTATAIATPGTQPKPKPSATSSSEIRESFE